MSSSSNRSDVLEESTSRSKEQRAQMPVTDTNSTIGMSADGLEGNFSRAAAHVDDLQKDDSPTSETKSNTSRSPSRALRKRPASFDEEEGSSKREHMGPPSRTQGGDESAITAPATVSDSEAEEPGLAREADPTSAIVVQEAPCLSMPISLDVADIRNPEKHLLCIAQINDESPIGSFAEDTEDYALQLAINAGICWSPSLKIYLFRHGIAGRECGQAAWGICDYVNDGWLVRSLKFHRVADCLDYKDIANPDSLAACGTDEEKDRLVCISLWTQPRSVFCDIEERDNDDESFRDFCSAVFYNESIYHLRIWFIAPDDLEGFEQQCLSFLLEGFKRRRNPHHRFPA